jgi:hypothetical protein
MDTITGSNPVLTANEITYMKHLNNFLEKAPLWQVYIAGWFLTGSFIAAMFYGFEYIGATRPEWNISGINCIKMGMMSGLPFGLMFTLSVSIMRKSQIFWDYAKVVENLIENANTKDEIESIFKMEFQNLRIKCLGGPQIPELNRLYTIMKTKCKYIK